jgi:hypothetical protein
MLFTFVILPALVIALGGLFVVGIVWAVLSDHKDDR